MRYFDLKKKIQKLFEEKGIDELSDIDWIAVEVLKVKRSFLPFVTDISASQEQEIMQAVSKRLEHIPIAYIFGKTEFFGREFQVDSNVLIPRMDTEVLVERLVHDIKQSQKELSVLDIGTGSGAIAITVKKETNAKVFAVDVSEKALEVAKQNAKKLEADVLFIQSDLFESVSDLKVDIVVSNPPYIETDVVQTLDKEVVSNEPILALDGGTDGLDFYRRIIKDAKQHLNAGGKVYFEIGYNQAESVSKLLEKDYEDIEVIKDYEGNDRVVIAKLR